MHFWPATWPTVDDIRIGARFFVHAVQIMRTHPVAGEAQKRLAERIARREANFLDLVRDTIYGNPASPYRRLLQLAGCEYGDLEQLVGDDGLEPTLQVLCRDGVYLTVDEAKGRRQVVRGNESFAITPSHLHNPRLVADLVSQTGGSGGAPVSVPSTLRVGESGRELELAAMGDRGWVFATWAVPGSTALSGLVRSVADGTPLVRWFSPIDPSASALHSRYAWSARAARWAGLLAGVRLPRPEYVPVTDPMPIVRWMADVLRSGKSPSLAAYVTGAVQVCQAAHDAGVDLRGAHFRLHGEPVTAVRLALIQRAGATVTMGYSSIATGSIGRGCWAPEAPDDIHLRHDLLGLVQAGPDLTPALPPQALLFTSLSPRTKVIMVNASIGDQAEVVERDCGCPMGRLGLHTHLHSIRSFEKLTAGGMTLLDSDVVHVLETVLPTRFGGAPSDYQLVDEESAGGVPNVRLIVHPRLGPLDADQVRAAFLEGIGAGSGVRRVMGLAWREAGWPAVERGMPLSSASGKVQHIQRIAR